MKLCFMCDLHLPEEKSAVQYEVMEWAISDVLKKQPDAVLFVGDITADGNETAYDLFVEKMQETGIPFLYIPGNSDLRNDDTKDVIYQKSSPCRTNFEDVSVFAINDSDDVVSEEQLKILSEATEKSIVFMHQPIYSHNKETVQRLTKWREAHPETKLFYGHLHYSFSEKNAVSLQAMDPDKAIGENPCITYYDTKTDEIRKSYFFCPVPADIYDYFGISCYDALTHLAYAAEKKLPCVELRPGCIHVPAEKLKQAVDTWRTAGGKSLSIHMSNDVGIRNGVITGADDYPALIELVKMLKADKITQHVPAISVKETKENPAALDAICEMIAEQTNGVPHDLIIGVENMHMTAKETADDTRRFGYIPDECLLFMQKVSEKSRHKVGIHFDIGHARNNAPFSQKYPVGSWLAKLGKYIVGYHMHQVTYDDNKFENHMPITDIYGKLISYASFFHDWTKGTITKAPVVFEMRPDNAYEQTLNTFERYRQKNVFDLHAHTCYSHCGRDNPEDVIETVIRNGIKTFGISDHNYGIGVRKAEYHAKMRKLAKQYENKIKLLCGIEIATYPENFDIEDPKEIKDFDYCLIEHITDEKSIVRENLIPFCKKMGILCGIAHTDLFAYCDMYDYEYSSFFRELAENNIFWEMNVSYDSIHGYREHAYVKEFMESYEKQQIVKDAGLCISIGFDGHRMEDYDGFRVHEMYDFLKKHHIRTADALL